jgi:LysR family glycine cleavage system transcriptional activator
MQAGQASSSLTLAAPRDITAKWLSARLAAYAKDQPELQFAIVGADEALDFTEANLDLALRLTDGPGENEGVRIGEAQFITVEAAAGGPDLRIDWPGCPSGEAPSAIRVADGGLAIEAAANGLGRATVPQLLADRDIAEGRVRSVGDPQPSARAYWLIAPLPQWRQKKVKALVEALRA